MSSKSEAICETLQKEGWAGFITSVLSVYIMHSAQDLTITGASHSSLLFLRIPLQIIFLADVK
jgi:hypothetical protein